MFDALFFMFLLVFCIWFWFVPLEGSLGCGSNESNIVDIDAGLQHEAEPEWWL